jgi:thioredoxin-like negative regulator of GroEL
VQSNASLAKQYNVRRLPTFVYVRDGEEVRRATGRKSERQLRRLCRDTWL